MTCDISLESFQWRLQLFFIPHHNRRSTRQVMRLQSCGSPICGNFGSPRTKSHLDVATLERHKVYYKGEGGGFPQVRAVVSLVCPSYPWFVLAPKVFQLCINHFGLVFCRSVWIIEACQFFLVPSRSSSMPLYPSKVLRTRERAPTPSFFCCFQFGIHIWVLQGVGSASIMRS